MAPFFTGIAKNLGGLGFGRSTAAGIVLPEIGAAYEGGYLICASGSVGWIVASSSTEVSRTWYCRNDAVTTANASATCGDWFIPTKGQLQSPGYDCRTYWDSYSPCFYWSSTQVNSFNAYHVSFGGGGTSYSKLGIHCVRAFRCITY